MDEELLEENERLAGVEAEEEAELVPEAMALAPKKPSATSHVAAAQTLRSAHRKK